MNGTMSNHPKNSRRNTNHTHHIQSKNRPNATKSLQNRRPATPQLSENRETHGDDELQTSATPLPPLLDEKTLPGPLGITKLSCYGALHQLNTSSGFTCKKSESIIGRSDVLASMLPMNSVACAVSAAWIWLGGTFPSTLDIVSSSHFRSKPQGLPIRIFNRNVTNEERYRVGSLEVTTPERTICDLALSSFDSDDYDDYRKSLVEGLFVQYNADIATCMNILIMNHYCPGSIQARAWLHDILPA